MPNANKQFVAYGGLRKFFWKTLPKPYSAAATALYGFKNGFGSARNAVFTGRNLNVTSTQFSGCIFESFLAKTLSFAIQRR
jgi:hypothetical protein